MSAGSWIRKLLGGSGTARGEKNKNGAGKKAKDNESGVAGFYYNYEGSVGGDNFRYALKSSNGVVIFSYESMEHRKAGEMTKEVSGSVLESLNEICVSCRVAEWDGFSKRNTGVCDGEGFSIGIVFGDGSDLYADGTNVFPERYGEFCERIHALFDPIRDELLTAIKEDED